MFTVRIWVQSQDPRTKPGTEAAETSLSWDSVAGQSNLLGKLGRKQTYVSKTRQNVLEKQHLGLISNLCMQTCTHAHMCTRTHTHTLTHVCMYACMHMCRYIHDAHMCAHNTHARTHAGMHTHAHMNTHVCMHTGTHTCTCAHMNTHMNAHTHACTHTSTNTHVCRQASCTRTRSCSL